MNKFLSSAITNSSFVLTAEISKAWRDIVGDELFKISAVKLVKYTSKFSISIHIQIINSASLLLKYKEDQIKNNIRKYIKHQASIKNINVIYKHCTLIDGVPDIITIEAKEKVLCYIEEKFENQMLKKALELLKTEMQHEKHKK